MKCAALIVTYNRLNKLQLCLRATFALKFDTIIVIDNASTDGTEQWLSSLKESRLQILRMKNNIGGAGGFKYGAQYIASLDIDWIFFFDDDAYPAENLLDNFIQFKKDNYQIFCCRVLTPDYKICSMNIPFKKIPSTLLATIHYKINPKQFLPQSDAICEVQTFSFVGTIIHKNILKKYSHIIIDDLFIYFDDLAFSYYLSQKNNKILYVPDFIFVHDVILHSQIFSNKKLYYLVRNLIITHKIYRNKPFFTLPSTLCRIMTCFLLCMIQKNRVQSLRYLFNGIKDGFNYKVKNILI